MMIYCPEEIITKKKDEIFVFLAGPIQGTYDWREEVTKFEKECMDENENLNLKITWLNPKRKNFDVNNFNFEEQTRWETEGLRICDMILFWIPKMTEFDPTRDYAQTTRMELLENLARGKKIIFGIEDENEIHASKYMKYKYEYYTGNQVYNSLDDCLFNTVYGISKVKRTFFTSDTHFSSQRTLELSKRPFRNIEEMDYTMVENWNKVVKPWDTVYHLGDFGDFKWVNYLNGDIIFLPGNYEKGIEVDEKLFYQTYKYQEPVYYGDWVLGHEPIYTKNIDKDKFCLFGHIHGRQKIKRFGLDVGVDSNNFTPMSEEEINFYKTAIEKFYDDEVFIN